MLTKNANETPRISRDPCCWLTTTAAAAGREREREKREKPSINHWPRSYHARAKRLYVFGVYVSQNDIFLIHRRVFATGSLRPVYLYFEALAKSILFGRFFNRLLILAFTLVQFSILLFPFFLVSSPDAPPKCPPKVQRWTIVVSRHCPDRRASINSSPATVALQPHPPSVARRAVPVVAVPERRPPPRADTKASWPFSIT